jgi:hypothetical protein
MNRREGSRAKSGIVDHPRRFQVAVVVEGNGGAFGRSCKADSDLASLYMIFVP